MEVEKQYQLLEAKYWAGESNLLEEAALFKAVEEQPQYFSEEIKSIQRNRQMLNSSHLPEDFEMDFWTEVEKVESKNNFNLSDFLRYAAVGIILLGIGYLFTQLLPDRSESQNVAIVEETITEDTYESPEEAFEEAKKALLMASGKLNQGEEKITEIKRFHQAKITVMKSAERE